MTSSPDSSAPAMTSLGGAEAPTPVGHVELRASWPIYAGGAWDEPDLTAEETLDVVIDNGYVDVLLEAVDHGSVEVTVQYRGDECTDRLGLR